MLPEWISAYFRFHKRERNGLLILSILTALVAAYNVYLHFNAPEHSAELLVEFGPSITKFDERITAEKELENPWHKSHATDEERIAAERFPFDPNTLDSAGWVRLGFSPKQSASILKYRNAGAVFRKPEDIKKLFVVDDELYEELHPFIEIEPLRKANQTEKSENRPKWESKKEWDITVELNTADSTMLVQLRGIGPSFSNRILKYRELLGGYVSVNQLLEVYGMDSARFIPIMSNIEVDTAIRIRMNLNEADVKQLVRHPYISLNQAKAIVNYREQHGPYRSVSNIRNIHLITVESFESMAPYLTVD